MATAKFGVPYFYVTWISAILSGEDRCRWAAWFKSRFSYEKVEDVDFDSAGYNIKHKELLNRRAEELRADGWVVTTERQNQFRYKGSAAHLGGKPDIVAEKGTVIRIVDAKTGVRMNKHIVQVLIYMSVWPRVKKEYAGYAIEGEVYYPSGEPVAISPTECGREVQQRIWDEIKALAFEMPPEKEPSEVECQFCSIPKSECPQRAAVEIAVGETTDF